MKFSNRTPGTSTTFMDADSEENILHLASDADGLPLVAFHLYDSVGVLVADEENPKNYPEGVCIQTSDGELLLSIPKNATEDIQYRLYNHTGELLTASDGVRTKIYPRLRMTGAGRSWVGRAKS